MAATVKILTPMNGSQYPRLSYVTVYGNYTDGVSKITVDYGDGYVTDATLNAQQKTFQATHQYPSSTPLGQKTVTATADDGASDAHSITVKA